MEYAVIGIIIVALIIGAIMVFQKSKKKIDEPVYKDVPVIEKNSSDGLVTIICCLSDIPGYALFIYKILSWYDLINQFFKQSNIHFIIVNCTAMLS